MYKIRDTVSLTQLYANGGSGVVARRTRPTRSATVDKVPSCWRKVTDWILASIL